MYTALTGKTLTHMQLADSGALDIPLSNINTATLTLHRARGKEKEYYDKTEKKLEGINERDYSERNF